jgi:hypothetical protein
VRLWVQFLVPKKRKERKKKRNHPTPPFCRKENGGSEISKFSKVTQQANVNVLTPTSNRGIVVLEGQGRKVRK